MEFDRRIRYASAGGTATHDAHVPGKHTLTQGMVQVHPAVAPSSPHSDASAAPLPPLPAGTRPTLQMLFRRRGPARDPDHLHDLAARGTATAASPLPHLAQIQRSFGRHDVSGVQAHVGPEAAASAQEMGAAAYAMGNHVVLGSGTDLHTVAHEAAHVVQQRGGVQLAGGVGEVGDAYERQADEVADRVVRGESAEALFDQHTVGADRGGSAGTVQRKNLEQAGLSGKLVQEGERGLVGTDKRVVKHYARTRTAVDDKGAAMRAVSQANAELAVELDAHARSKWGIEKSNDKWTTPEEALDDPSLNKIDPFFLTVIAPFKTEAGLERLELTHQHAKEWTGYIEAIRDTSNMHTLSVPTMYIMNSEDPSKVDQDQGRNPKFSNVHDTTDNNTLLDLTTGGEEKNLDAYTKLAGEGARFRCVRSHAPRLRNTTRFYVKSRGRRLQAVSFVNLWKNWARVFGKKI